MGLNQLLGNNIALQVDPSKERPVYTAAFRLDDNLWFKGNYASADEEDSASGASANEFTGTIDYRFRKNWSLSTELGASGGTVDLMYQYRY